MSDTNPCHVPSDIPFPAHDMPVPDGFTFDQPNIAVHTNLGLIHGDGSFTTRGHSGGQSHTRDSIAPEAPDAE